MDLFDVYQQAKIKQTHQVMRLNQDNNDHRQRANVDEFTKLHERIDRLLLVNEAMWQLLCECTGLTEAHLQHRMYELDMADGQRDERRQPRSNPCECGAMVNPQAKVCMFCGSSPPERPTFDAL